MSAEDAARDRVGDAVDVAVEVLAGERGLTVDVEVAVGPVLALLVAKLADVVSTLLVYQRHRGRLVESNPFADVLIQAMGPAYGLLVLGVGVWVVVAAVVEVGAAVLAVREDRTLAASLRAYAYVGTGAVWLLAAVRNLLLAV